MAEPKVTEGLKQEGVLTVGIRGSSTAPFVITSLNALDTATGVDIELGCALADQMGLQAAFVSVDDIAEALSGTCDVVLNASTSEANGFDVAGDYAESALALFHKGEVTVVTPDDINGARVAVQDGSSAQMALRVTALEITEVPCSTLNEAFDVLDADEADYVFCNVDSGAYLCSWREGVEFAGALSDPKVQGIALASGEGAVQDAVRAAYSELEGNGVLAEIRRSWFGNLPVLTAEHVVANVPMRETSGESLDDFNTNAEVLQSAQDGSTAGANAVTMSQLESYSPSTSTEVGYSSNDGDYGYGYSSGYSNSTNYSTNYDYSYDAGTGYDTSYDSNGYADAGGGDYSDYGGGSDYAGGEYADYGGSGEYTESY